MIKWLCDLCWLLAWKTPLKRFRRVRMWGHMMWVRGRWWAERNRKNGGA